MLYDINENPKTIKEWLLFAVQQMLSILTATILISTICGTNISAGLVGGGLATITFLALTGFKVPMFISNSGATVSAVIGTIALAKSVEDSFTGVLIGGIIIFIMNIIFSVIIKKLGVEFIDRILPPVVVGTAILVIGLNLMTFIPTYVQINGEYSLLGIGLALLTMIFTALYNHYGKGMTSNLAFLFGLLTSYLICIFITLLGIAPLVDFTKFTNISLLKVPDLTIFHIDFKHFDWSILPNILLMFFCVNLGAVTEHIGDILTCSEITGHNIKSEVGFDKTLIADGAADLIGCLFGNQPTTTYGESLATIAISKVASTKVILLAAIMTICLGFIEPFNAAVVGMPMCLFGGIAVLAYAFIALSGLKVLLNNNINFNSTKNTLIFGSMLSLGASGLTINIGQFTLNGVSLSIIIGIFMNIILREKKTDE